jgi:RNAse (barnase) inhibitor barstar
MIAVVGAEVSVAELVRDSHARGVQVSVVPAGADKRESLERFAEALDFPGWFGHNLDALADCLHHLALHSSRDWHLIWDGVQQLKLADEQAYAGVCGVLNEIAEEHERFSATVVER